MRSVRRRASRHGTFAATRRLKRRVSSAEAGRRLDEVAALWLEATLGAPLSKAKVRRLIMAGGALAGGRPLRRPGLPLRAGEELELRFDPACRPGNRKVADLPFLLTSDRILYEDDVLLAIDKPPGLPTVPTADPRRPSLVGSVKAFLSCRGSDPGPSQEPYLGVHQRLDRDTSGVVLFAKHPTANPGLASAFASRLVEKTYAALTRRPLRPHPSAWSVESRLATVGTGRSAAVASVRRGGGLARTEFRILEAYPRGLLVEARPRTGRKHQIRVQLAEGGLAVLGDELYGSEASVGGEGLDPPRQMLHARKLSLDHPHTGARLVITSPYPPDFLRVWRALRASVSSGGRPRGRRD